MANSKKHYCLVESHDYVRSMPSPRTLALKFRNENDASAWRRWYNTSKKIICDVRRAQHPYDILLDMSRLNMSAAPGNGEGVAEDEDDDQSE